MSQLALVNSIWDRLGETILVPRKLHTIKRLQIIEPERCLGILGEEDATDPVFVAALKESQNKCLLAHDIFDASHFDLSGGAGHRRAASCTDEAGGIADGIGVESLGLDEGHVEVLLGTGVARQKHVVGDDTKTGLLAPLVGPNFGRIIDAPHNGRLGPDGGACLLLDALDGGLDLVGGELPLVTQVGHDRYMSLAFVTDSTEEGDELVGVLVGRETLGPEAQRASTNAKILDVG